jgi:hypothetical protein
MGKAITTFKCHHKWNLLTSASYITLVYKEQEDSMAQTA